MSNFKPLSRPTFIITVAIATTCVFPFNFVFLFILGFRPTVF